MLNPLDLLIEIAKELNLRNPKIVYSTHPSLARNYVTTDSGVELEIINNIIQIWHIRDKIVRQDLSHPDAIEIIKQTLKQHKIIY